MGKEGSRAYYNGMVVEANPFLTKDTIETTGAGDTFTGCILHYILNKGLENLDTHNLREMLNFANAAASIIIHKKRSIVCNANKGRNRRIITQQIKRKVPDVVLAN